MHRSSRRGHPSRGPLAALAAALVLFALSVVLPSGHAAFSAVTDSQGNALTADRLAPPSAFNATTTCSSVPLITHRGTSTATGLESVTVPVPSGTAAGDVLVVQVAHASTTTGLSTPTGWSRILHTTSGTAVTSAVFLRVATTGQTAPTFTLPAGSGVQLFGGALAYRGVDTAQPVNALEGVGGYGLTPFAPAVTTTRSDTVLVRFIANEAMAFAAPAGVSSRWSQGMGGTSTGGVTAWDEPFAGPGTAPSRSVPSGATASSGTGQTVALRRPAGVPTASLTWTPSTSGWATGYRLERLVGTTVQSTRTLTPVGTSSTTDPDVANGTSYSFRLRTVHGTWRSTSVSDPTTPNC